MSKTLGTANRYLRNRVLRNRLVFKSVASSSAIEGIHAPFRRPAKATGKSPSPATHRATARKTRNSRVRG
jgi:hypothetical protein